LIEKFFFLEFKQRLLTQKCELILTKGDFYPMISLFFTMSIVYTFISMVWFALINEFATKNNMPKCLVTIACFIERMLYCKYFQKSLKIYDMSSKKDKKKEISSESHATALNYLAFFLLFLIMLICNLVIWISIL